MSLDENFKFENSYAVELSGFYVPWKGDEAPKPTMIKLNCQLASELNLKPILLNSSIGTAMLVGSYIPKSSTPLAQAYAGHQFGNFSKQLGDGRALLIGEVIDKNGKRRDLHLKGSGPTPFSRGGDGKAVLGPMLREYLISEAMAALAIPTTRALAVVTTGENIMREVSLPGAVLARVASSHIRVGSFQFYAAQYEFDKVQQLADYTIWRHFPELEDSKEKYFDLLREVIHRQVSLVAKWMSVGFVHGVMNTDNVLISGETIDYGPCAFIDSYDPHTVFSSIDLRGRYAYGNQPVIAQWNLYRFAEALIGIINPDNLEPIEKLVIDELKTIPDLYLELWQNEMRKKLGLIDEEESDKNLINDLYKTLEGQNVDFTNFFRQLANAARGEADEARALFDDPVSFDKWLLRWLERLNKEEGEPSISAGNMDKVNPIYIPRNHMVEAALQAAVGEEDFSLFEELSEVLDNPFELQAGKENYTEPAPEGSPPYKTFCGT